MTGSGKTAWPSRCSKKPRSTAFRHRDRPEGRSRQSTAQLPIARRSFVSALDRRSRSRAPRPHARRRGAVGRGSLARRTRRVGPAAERIARFAAAADARSTRRARAPEGRSRCCARSARRPRPSSQTRSLARARPEHGFGPARPARHRRGSPAQPRTHPRRDTARSRLARRRAPRPRRADRAGPEAPLERVGVLDLESFFPPGSAPARAGTQQPRSLADLRRMGEASPSTPRDCSTRRTAARASRSSRSPTLRRRAHVRGDAGALRAGVLDADAVGHFIATRALLHGRGVRLLPTGCEPAGEDADADVAEAGACLRLGVVLRRRTPSISTTRVSPTPAPGSWGGSRPSATKRA